MGVADAEARAATRVENERIAELKIKTLGRALHLPEDELASVMTAQEITNEKGLEKERKDRPSIKRKGGPL